MAKQLALTLALLLATAPLTMAQTLASDTVTVETYTIDGSTLAQLQTRMQRAGPNGHWARTVTRWKWDKHCRMRFEATIMMPRLLDRSRLGDENLAEWDRMLTALRAHEDTHVEIGRAWAGAIQVAKCDPNQIDAINSEWRAKERRFDVETQHGRTEGVYLGVE